MRAFGALAQRHRNRKPDPAERERFQAVKTAYQTLTNYESRLRYNIEHGLPDPPKHGKQSQASGAIDGLVSLIPGNWYVWAFALVWLVLQVAWLFERQWMWDHTSPILP